MSKIEDLKADIERLPADELAELFRWLLEKERESRDEGMKADSQAGSVDDNQFLNFYKCPDDATEWTMVWSCMCDDRCPKCNAEIEPYMSEDWPINSPGAAAGNS